MTPLPVAESFDAFNARLVDTCTKRRQAILRSHRTTIAERMQADLSGFMKLPRPPSQAYRFFREYLRSRGKVRHLRGLGGGIRSLFRAELALRRFLARSL